MSAWRVALVAAVAAAATAPTARAVVSTDTPAALLVFPLIRVDDAAGIDSLIQLTNTDGADVTVRCLYEDPAGDPALTAFTIRLTANQPVAWRAGLGLDTVAGDGGTIPPLGAGSFTGALRCVAVNTDGIPAERNVLAGSATIERASSTPAVQLDSARYNATGFDAIPGALNGDEQLVLGGDAAEYAACPASLLLQSFFDGAVLDLGAAGGLQHRVSTTLALVTCAQTPGSGAATSVTFTATNEHGQTLTTSRSVTAHDVLPLSTIDTSDPSRSIFSAALQGTLTGTIGVAPTAGSGVLALAVQQHADPTDATRFSSAATSPQLVGVRAAPDVVDLVVPTPTPVACLGDCDGDGTVAINELITGVGIALGNRPLSACQAFDGDDSDSVAINELIAAVNNALTGCP
jgi:hypothetical protein